MQDQETLVVQVYPLGFEQSRHFSKGAGPIVDSVFGRIVSISCTGDDDLRVRNELECISSGLTNEKKLIRHIFGVNTLQPGLQDQ